jgi:hypothetical protein
MGVERTTVEMDMREGGALQGARRISAELERVERNARQAQGAVSRVNATDPALRSRFGGLLAKAGFKVGADAVEVSAFRFGASGFELKDSFKKGLVGGANVMLAGAIVGSVARTTASTFGAVADVRDYLDDHPNANIFNATERVLQNAGRGMRERLRAAYIGAMQANPFNDVVQQFMRMFRLDTVGRLSTADGESYIDQGIAEFFGDLGPLDAAIKDQAFKRRMWLQEQDQRERQLEARNAALRKIDEATEAVLGGLKTSVARPRDVRLNREQNREFQRRYEDARRKRIMQAAQGQREQVNAVYDGEGR